MKALKFLFLVVAFFATFIPLVAFSAYLFTFDKQALIDILIKIPKDRFWLFMIPAIIMCYGCTCWLFWKLVEMDRLIALPQKEVYYKEVYYLEDDHLSEKLSRLISVRPGTSYEDSLDKN